jgi:hypothetical protein
MQIKQNSPDCPRAGQGVNEWVNQRVVYLLRRRIKPHKVMILVLRETAHCGRETRQDIAHSIETWCAAKQQGIKLKHEGGRMGFTNEINLELQKETLFTYGGIDAEYFRQLSAKATPLDALREMFGDRMMIIGRNQQHAELVRFSELTDVNTYQFIVPNPAEKEYGLTKFGKVSQRCLDMIPARWYLPVEFDSGLSLDDQCRVHFCLARQRELRMLVYSGGKSIHGWYHVSGIPEEENKKFMQFAISLGADLMMWTRCQWTRIPGGINMKTGKQQEMIYYTNGSH